MNMKDGVGRNCCSVGFGLQGQGGVLPAVLSRPNKRPKSQYWCAHL